MNHIRIGSIRILIILDNPSALLSLPPKIKPPDKNLLALELCRANLLARSEAAAAAAAEPAGPRAGAGAGGYRGYGAVAGTAGIVVPA